MSAPVRYVVRRQEYAPAVAGVQRVLPEKWTAVATFPKLADAEAEYVKLLTQFRRTQNPFQLGGPNLFYQTSLPPFALHDYLLDHDIAPPPTAATSNPNYVFWWVKGNRTFTDDQRAVVWQACDKLKPFDVIEEDDRRAVWLVVDAECNPLRARHEWELRAERGGILSAYKTLREANRVCRERRTLLIERYAKLLEELDGQTDEDRVEVVSVPFGGEALCDKLIILCRQDLGKFGWFGRAFVWSAQSRFANDGRRVPMAAYRDMESANTGLQIAVNRARRISNPFQFAEPRSLAESMFEAHEDTDDELPNGLTLDDAFAAVRRLDTTPPPPESNDLLADWYDQVVRWSPEFIDVIWGTFADFRLFEVIEVPLG